MNNSSTNINCKYGDIIMTPRIIWERSCPHVDYLVQQHYHSQHVGEALALLGGG